MKSTVVGLILIAVGAFVFVLPVEEWRSVFTTHEEVGVSIAAAGVLTTFAGIFAFVFRMLYSAFLALLAVACLNSVLARPAASWATWDLVVLGVGIALGLFALLLVSGRLRRRDETGRSKSDELSSKAAHGATSAAFEETLSD
ncbi:MAG: hypothetical protein KDA49_08550 [Rhodospirillaceae bacterium]|nr:hypothetical protein [Rhodospirillaceae bacterium]MCA8932506.1 hypothetical protein [Rhodospirillaceae bacterium]